MARSKAYCICEKALVIITTILPLLSCCAPVNGQESSPARQDEIPAAQKLAAEERWQDLRQLVEADPHRSAELEYYHGLALAHLGRFDEARKAFLAGRRAMPHDKRFPTELAGVAFKQKKYPQAASYLRAALRLDPTDAYVNDFLATVYFLQGNLEAALKYWNQAGKPNIQEVRTGANLKINPVLLDHAFAFSPASVLRREELLASEARLHALDIFPSYRLDLLPRAEQTFDLQFQAQERNGFGNTKLQALVSVFRGLPYQEVDPEYFNLQGSATNVVSLLRWDAQKRRASGWLSGPFHRDPKWRYRLGLDLRDENWVIRSSFTGPAPPLAALNLRREVLRAEIVRVVGGRLRWSADAEFSHRDFRNVLAGSALTSALLAPGYALAEELRLGYDLWRVPERRFIVASQISTQVAHLWSNPGQSFARAQAALESEWLPQSRGDDYATRWDLRAGDTFGHAPFDELFMLGLERDNDLWLRAHIGTRDGRKGSAPLGYRYFLSNWETDKIVFRNGLVTLKLGPFVDTGKIGGATSALASNKWLWDTGGQFKVSVLGIGVSVIYGKDLRSGNNAFYTVIGR